MATPASSAALMNLPFSGVQTQVKRKRETHLEGSHHSLGTCFDFERNERRKGKPLPCFIETGRTAGCLLAVDILPPTRRPKSSNLHFNHYSYGAQNSGWGRGISTCRSLGSVWATSEPLPTPLEWVSAFADISPDMHRYAGCSLPTVLWQFSVACVPLLHFALGSYHPVNWTRQLLLHEDPRRFTLWKAKSHIARRQAAHLHADAGALQAPMAVVRS